MNPKSEVKGGSRKRFWLCLALALLIFICVALLSLLFIIRGYFSREPVSAPLRKVDNAALFSASGKIQGAAGKIFALQPAAEAELVLSAAEVNAILSNARVFGTMFATGDFRWPEHFSIHFEKGGFHCEYSHKLAYKTPFGQYLNVHVDFSPKILGGNIDLEVNSAMVGNSAISPGLVRAQALKFIESKKVEVEQFRRIVIDCVSEGSSLRIRYRPAELRKFIESLAG